MSDLIDRQVAISAICSACGKIDCDEMNKCEKLQLPPANCSEFPNNSDTISRRAAIEALRAMQTYKLFAGDDMLLIDQAGAQTELMMLPSTQPERIRGRWIPMERKNLFRCSECGAVIYSESEYDRNEFYKFCGRCGADMRGEQNG